jgi:hypothetical protein
MLPARTIPQLSQKKNEKKLDIVARIVVQYNNGK